MVTLRLKKLIALSAVLVLAATASGCASNNLRSDYDRTADFGQYKTYNFYRDAGPGGGQYQSLFSTYVIAAITREMEGRGYTKSGTPDLLVNFNALVQEKTKVTTTPATGVGGYYGYRRGFYDPWAGYGYATETHVSQYTEGTFNIDLVDVRRNRLVWEAVGVGRVTAKKLENMEQVVNEAVPKYFALYPYRAASNTPVPAAK